jgi:hypothetical protein
MATSTTEARVDVGALAGAIRNDAAERVASLLVVGFDSLEEDEKALNQPQKIELVQCAIEFLDGLEREVAVLLVDGLTRDGVAVWGLPRSLADLTPGGDDA